MPKLSDPLLLPCGVELPNRIGKAALSENIGEKGGRPGDRMKKLYEMWADCGAGLNLSGNVMVHKGYMVEQFNVVLESEEFLEDFKEVAANGQKGGTHFWMQINHPGRQAVAKFNKDVVGVSPIKVEQKGLFKTPRPLEDAEIEQMIERYGTTAQLAKKAGYKGVQIHGAHGYLVSQFLSPKTNKREDRWGGSLENRSRFLREVYRNMRSKVGAEFPIGMKINSADFLRGGFQPEDSLQVIQMMEGEGIDLVEVSGGTYEKAAMMGVTQKESTKRREAYFLEFAAEISSKIKVPLMLTGGFRTKSVMQEALDEGVVDLIGMGRPFTANRHVAREMLAGRLDEIVLPDTSTGFKSLDKMGAVDLTWHAMQMGRMGEGKEPDLNMSAWSSVWDLVKRVVF